MSSQTDKDFHVALKIRNGRIVRRMRDRGIETIHDLAERSGVTESTLGMIIGFKRSPMGAFGEWTKAAYALSSFFRCEPEDLWPEHIAGLKRCNGDPSLFVDMDELRQLPASDTFVDRKLLTQALKSLTPRQYEVIQRRFGLDGNPPEELQPIANDHHTSRERIRQIENAALRKLRHPVRQLLDAIPDEEHIMPKEKSWRDVQAEHVEADS